MQASVFGRCLFFAMIYFFVFEKALKNSAVLRESEHQYIFNYSNLDIENLAENLKIVREQII